MIASNIIAFPQVQNSPKLIKAGDTLTARSVCDHNCVFSVEIIARKGNFATVKTSMDGTSRKKIHKDSDGNEFLFALGQYSMAPIFRAK